MSCPPKKRITLLAHTAADNNDEGPAQQTADRLFKMRSPQIDNHANETQWQC